MGSIPDSLRARMEGPSDQKAGIGGIRSKSEITDIMFVFASAPLKHR